MAQAEDEVSELKTALADLATFVRSGLQQVQTEINASIAKVHDQTSTNIAKLQETADRVLRSVQAVEEWQPEVNANLTVLQSTVEGLGTRVSNLEASPSRMAPTTLGPGGHGVAQQHQGATSRTPSVHERTLANVFQSSCNSCYMEDDHEDGAIDLGASPTMMEIMPVDDGDHVRALKMKIKGAK
ncbi:hypothetical protein QYE76_016464 [Lolium multiflorum]|uniref:Uncharacterized protein n=1 Tax=Lolium multiflorum TaxID=4521 RepID=A0AAD8VEH5_LOLMU|nr:hypothetical protein QYE76_016464 [Lolium multiflorum]